MLVTVLTTGDVEQTKTVSAPKAHSPVGEIETWTLAKMHCDQYMEACTKCIFCHNELFSQAEPTVAISELSSTMMV